MGHSAQFTFDTKFPQNSHSNENRNSIYSAVMMLDSSQMFVG